MSKWQKIQPDQIRVGDRVRVKTINQPDAYDFTVFERGATWIGVFATVNHREWYIRKPKKAKPDTNIKLELEETQAQLNDAMMTIDLKNSELTKVRRVLADLQDADEQRNAHLVEAQVQLQDALATIDDQATEIDKWKTKAVALAKQMRADRRYTEPTRPDEPPVGAFFRVDRTAREYVRIEGVPEYYLARGLGHWGWDHITEPGDTITMLELREVSS